MKKIDSRKVRPVPFGLIRRMDEMGRIVIPKQFRDKLGIKEEDELEIFLTKNGIYIEKTKQEECDNE